MNDQPFDVEGLLSQAAQGKVVASPPTWAPSGPINYLPTIDVGGTRGAAVGQPGSQFAPSATDAATPATPNVMAIPKASASPNDAGAPQNDSFDVEGLLGAAARGKLKYTPPPPSGSTWGGIARNVGAGLTDVAATAGNIAADPFGNLVGRPIATAVQFAHDALAPALGVPRFPADVRDTLVGDTAPQPGTAAVEAIGSALGTPPSKVAATGGAEQLARKLTGAVGAGALAGPTAAIASGAGTIAGDVAQQAAPDWAKPGAELLGNIAGAMPVAAAVPLASKYIARPVANAVGNLGLGGKTTIGGVAATKPQIAAASGQVTNAIGPEGANIIERSAAAEQEARQLEAQIADDSTSTVDKAAAQARLAEIQGRRVNLVPGSEPTTAQLTGSGGTLEKAHRTAAPDPFIARDAAQNNARLAHINAVQPEGDVTSVGQHLTNMLNQIEAEEATTRAGATGDVQAATEGLGGTATPATTGTAVRAAVAPSYQRAVGGARRGVEAAGEALGGTDEPEATGAAARGALASKNAGARTREGALWEAIDPEGKLALPVGGAREEAASLLKEVSPALGDVVDGREAAILSGAAGLPDVIPFRDARRLRSNIGAAERALRAAPGNDQSLRRLGILKDALDGDIEAGANAAAAADPGVAERLAQMAREQGPPPPGSSGATSPADAAERAQGGQPVPGGRSGQGNAGSPGEPAAGVPPAGRAASDGAGRSGVGGRNSAVAAQAPTRGRKPESLIEHIIAKGGMQDPGGDIAAMGGDTVHHQGGGRLINPKGRYPDYVREGAVEEGFLKNDADINDLNDAIAEELAGNPVYRMHEQAEGDAYAAQARETERSRIAYEQAVGAVEDHMPPGVRLTDEEGDHAAQLVAEGMDPADAIREAARAGEETVLQRHAEANAIGAPGVPFAAQQAEMPVSGTAKGLRANFDPEAGTRYAAARAATLARKTTYGQGPVGEVLRPGKQGADYAVHDADVTRKFLNGKPTEPDNVRKYIAAVGGDAQAVAAMRDGLVSDLRHAPGIFLSDGAVNPDKFAQWIGKRGKTIDQFPGLRGQLNTVAKAQQFLDRTVAEQGVVGDVMKEGPAGFAVPDADVTGRFLSGKPTEPANVAAYIKAVGGAPAAVEAMQDGLVNDLRSRGIIGADGLVNNTAFIRWQRQRAETIKQFPGLADRFATAAEAQKTLDQVTAAGAQRVRDFQNGVAKDFLKEDPKVAVSRAFGGSSERKFGELVDLVRGNPDAEAGLRRGVVDYLIEKTRSAVPTGDVDDMMKAAVFRNFIRQNNLALKKLFGGQGIQNLDMVAADLRRAAQRTAATGGSDTAANVAAGRKFQLGPKEGMHLTALAFIGEQLGDVLAGAAGHGGIAGKAVGAGTALAGYLIHRLRQAGIQTTNDLVREAMLHPEVARELMAKANENEGLPVTVQRRIGNALAGTLAADQSDAAQKERLQ